MKKNILFIIIALLGFSSCSDFLEPKSPSEYVPKSADALNEMLLGSAYSLSNHSAGEPLWAYHEIFSDDIEMTGVALDFTISLDAFIALYSWDPDVNEKATERGQSVNIWAYFYKLIMATNAALDYLDDVKGSDNEKAYVRAQAYALRAFYYFHLVNIYGEPYMHNRKALGVPLKLVSDLTDGYDRQNTVEEVYCQILKDLDEAEKNFLALPEGKQNSATYRINLPSVQLIRARVCLHMGDREGAAKYANKVIRDWGYQLNDLNSFVATATKRNPDFVTLENPETIWAFGNPDNVISLLRATSGYWADGKTSSNALCASGALINSYKTGDLRKDCYLMKVFSNNYKEVPGEYSPWSKMSAGSYNILAKNKFGLFLRLSEAYLILAEAVYDTDKELALKMVNDLRKKRYTESEYKEVDYSGQELLDFIREERRRELCFEGQRWFDLRRYGMPSFSRRWMEKGEYVGSYTIEKEDAAYTIPIPSVVLLRNPALIQNKLGNRKTLN